MRARPYARLDRTCLRIGFGNGGNRIREERRAMAKWLDLKHTYNLKGKLLFSCLGIVCIALGTRCAAWETWASTRSPP